MCERCRTQHKEWTKEKGKKRQSRQRRTNAYGKRPRLKTNSLGQEQKKRFWYSSCIHKVIDPSIHLEAIVVELYISLVSCHLKKKKKEKNKRKFRFHIILAPSNLIPKIVKFFSRISRQLVIISSCHTSHFQSM